MLLSKTIRIILFTSAVFISSAEIGVAEEAKVGDYTKADAIAISQLSLYARSKGSWENIASSLSRGFDAKDPEGDGIQADEKDVKTLANNASRRASSITNWLRLDLDGDGSITEQELRDLSNRPLNTQRISGLRKNPVIKPTEEQAEQIYQAIIEGAKLPYLNNDGTVTIDEMLEQSRNDLVKQKPKYRSKPEIGFSYDVNKDNVITKDEYLTTLKNIFVKFDTNHDGRFSWEEVKKLRDVNILTRVLIKPKQ